MNGCLTNQQYADVGGPLGSGGRLGSAGRRVDVPLSSEDGSLDGSDLVVVSGPAMVLPVKRAHNL